MDIYEYGQVDPLEVLHLNQMCLGFPLTPETASIIYHEDPRAFPFFCLYAKADGVVAGQVGVFRLPVVSTEGADEVGGVWAVSTHPVYAGQGIALRLMEEAHARMRAAGLRFSTLDTDRYRVAHRLYAKLGYENVFSSANVMARRETLPNDSTLKAEPAGSTRLPLADDLFEQIAKDYLGFARRHTPFFPFLERREYLSGQDLWLLWHENTPVGYAAAFLSRSVLRIANLLLVDAIDPVAAVAAVALQTDAPYVQVTLDQPVYLTSFIEAGFQTADATWGSFMVKPLVPGITANDFRRLYGVGTDRFLISYMDTT